MECDYKINFKMQRFKSFQKNGNKTTKHINAKEQKEGIKRRKVMKLNREFTINKPKPKFHKTLIKWINFLTCLSKEQEK